MPKLLLAGCSFSHQSDTPDVYGKLIADKLGYEYIHEARACGSNDAIWRTVTDNILSGDITDKDIVIIQYTEQTRREFWSMNERKRPKQHEGEWLRDKYKEFGDLIRFKIGAYEWQDDKIESRFMELYEKHFLNDNYTYEHWTQRNLQFQYFLKHYNINTYFASMGTYTPRRDEFIENNVIEFYKDKVYTNWRASEYPYNLADDDIFHMNAAGHKKVAAELYEFIQQNPRK